MRASVGRKLPRRGQPVTPKHPRTSNFKCHEKANTSFPVTCHRVVGSRDGGSGFPAQRTTDFQFACGYPSTGAGAARAAACPAAGAGIPSGTAIPATATARTIRTAAGATGCPGWTTSRSPNLQGMIVKSGDKYVLQDSATGTTYDIDHQDEVSKHVGRKVQVTGTLDPNGKMIHLQPSER